MKEFTNFDEWYDEAIRTGRLVEEEVQEGMREVIAATRGYQLRTLRKSRGLTQQDVAARIGVSQSRISDIENGKVERMQVQVIAKYVQALGGELSLSFSMHDFQQPSHVLFGPEELVLDAPESNFQVSSDSTNLETFELFDPRQNFLTSEMVGNNEYGITDRAA